MRSRAPTPGRLIAPLLVALWVIQSLLAVAHFQEHSHRYCPAHGAFEEAPAARGASSAARSQDERAVERQTASSEGSPRHEACDVLASSERPQWLGVPPAVAPPLRACPDVRPPVTESPRALTSLSILDLAPKLSPPARA